MTHIIKYLFLAFLLFASFCLFYSNLPNVVSLSFEVPFITKISTPPISINYWLMISFCAGIVFAAILGALRVGKVRELTKQIHEQERSIHQVLE
ncbi:MAG: hypothetical protein A3G32_07515 [Deltaproteobacteria bacterium RIFCSPLOWO2_12_FULL_40_28]|nr:MAG: hypothetical protein A3C45_03305 [Deltaproteobacteria bacterium RIFCSPHIGHO2_02_FULL_40_28]OGQ20267.1 MAG: hypothetical protein A3E27_06410 [Deltaproteobacteria bacterium RIFCSPHIGHO2_12_FULL_40_32]OGQ40378.1 MAG: hypothetical protein A3I69_06920 [Deltaproteobacteria bacterium RIFCSPLOWO2_02_FULL_40_36]OGQ54847.1 MAG: hypothetical protein A3G32_07515 [Deltaproteobacteria bacterium RIFCSPLOWO2_12_FULL_40_28]